MLNFGRALPPRRIKQHFLIKRALRLIPTRRAVIRLDSCRNVNYSLYLCVTLYATVINDGQAIRLAAAPCYTSLGYLCIRKSGKCQSVIAKRF